MALLSGLDIDPATQSALTEVAAQGLRRTNALGETFTRLDLGVDAVTPISASAQFTAIELTAGTVVSKITFASNSTAATTPTHQWFSLYDSNLNLLGVTADDGATAWAANAEKTLTLASPYTVKADAAFYVGVAIVAATPPTLCGVSGPAFIYGAAPSVAFIDSTHNALAAPATAPAVATNSAGANPLWAYVS